MEQTAQSPVGKRRTRQELVTLLKEFEKCEVSQPKLSAGCIRSGKVPFIVSGINESHK